MSIIKAIKTGKKISKMTSKGLRPIKQVRSV